MPKVVSNIWTKWRGFLRTGVTIGAVHPEAQSGATVDGGRTSAAEAEAFIAWRDAALSHMFQQLAAVEASEIAPPSIEEFIGGITPIVWPNP